MADFRIETRVDPDTGMIFAELYSADSNEPITATKPVYRSHDEARQRIAEMLRESARWDAAAGRERQEE